MTNFQLVVTVISGLFAARVAFSCVKYIAVAYITKIHGEELTKEYNPEDIARLLKYGL